LSESSDILQHYNDLLLSKSKSILLVDDEVDIVSIIKHSLQAQGLNVYSFTHPLLALEHFQLNSKNYGLVLSDIRMPSMTGFELARKVRKINPTIKILLMSAFDIDKDLHLSKLMSSAKIDGFIQKPISPNELIRLIQKYFVKMENGEQHTNMIDHHQRKNRLETTIGQVHNSGFKRVLFYLIVNSKGSYNRARILKLINFHPTNANQISCELKLHYRTVIHHLEVLSNYKLIITDNKESYGAVYFLTPLMEKNYYLFLEMLSELDKTGKSKTYKPVKERPLSLTEQVSL
jgi:CheY-like chemotaxis protein/DNA-binding transcriptional ArsR family regulator